MTVPDLTDLAWSDMGQPHPHAALEDAVTDQPTPETPEQAATEPGYICAHPNPDRDFGICGTPTVAGRPCAEHQAATPEPVDPASIPQAAIDAAEAAVRAHPLILVTYQAIRAMLAAAIPHLHERNEGALVEHLAATDLALGQALGDYHETIAALDEMRDQRDAARADVQRLTGEMGTVGRQLASVTVERDQFRARVAELTRVHLPRYQVAADFIGGVEVHCDECPNWSDGTGAGYLRMTIPEILAAATRHEIEIESHPDIAPPHGRPLNDPAWDDRAAGNRSDFHAAGPAAPIQGADHPQATQDAQGGVEPVDARAVVLDALHEIAQQDGPIGRLARGLAAEWARADQEPVADALAGVLTAIDNIDPSWPDDDRPDPEDRYAVRNRLIWRAAGYAAYLGYPVGIGIDTADPAWPLLYVELPNGQVSWHLPAHPRPWDGHDHATKRGRILTYDGQPPSSSGQPVNPADLGPANATTWATGDTGGQA